ncbi:tetratricopeptide repeat protein [Rosistilla oblonga]|uniref:tetratricopeptide repeat protein n=1 Tax=Rosistilla oblonga TaxID=2527990 RepID=UPI003A97DF4F
MSTSPPSSFDQAWQFYHRGEYAEVVGMLQPRSEELSAEELQLLGLALHDLGRPLEAADAIEKASLICPVSDEVRIALASCYAQLRRTDLARELYLQLALTRKLPPALMLRIAAGLEAIDSPQLAMQVCEWITEQDDSIAQAYYDMGRYAACAGQPLYITEVLTIRALQLEPQNVQFRVGLVSLLIQLRRDDEAIRELLLLSRSDLQQVRCFSCLERIAEMLQRHGHTALARDCRAQVARLRSVDRNDPPTNIHREAKQ